MENEKKGKRQREAFSVIDAGTTTPSIDCRAKMKATQAKPVSKFSLHVREAKNQVNPLSATLDVRQVSYHDYALFSAKLS